MSDRGIDVEWSDNRKYITFTDIDRREHGESKCKIRNNKLEKYYHMDFSKEGLEHEFEVNARSAETAKSAAKQLEHGLDSAADAADCRAGTGNTEVKRELRTIPAWLVNRKDDLSTVCYSLISQNHWLNQNISEITNPTAAKIISFLLCGVIVIGIMAGIVLMTRKTVRALKMQWKSLNTQRKAVWISLTAVSLLAGVVLAEKMTAVTLNVVSWWIVLITGINIVFYRVNLKKYN